MKISSPCKAHMVAAIAAAAYIVGVASPVVAQSVDEVIAKCIAAQGGRDALTKLKSLERKGTVNVDGAFGQMEGTVEEVAIPWKKARRALDLQVFAQKEGWNGTVAWRDGMMGLQELEGEQAAQIKQAAELNPFVRVAEGNVKAEKLDDETVEGVAYYVIQLTPKERPPVKIYIDKASEQIKRTTLTQNNPQFGKVDVVMEVSDYQDFGPVKLPTKSKVQVGEALRVETTFTETKVNGPVDDAVFDKPKEDK